MHPLAPRLARAATGDPVVQTDDDEIAEEQAAKRKAAAEARHQAEALKKKKEAELLIKEGKLPPAAATAPGDKPGDKPPEEKLPPWKRSAPAPSLPHTVGVGFAMGEPTGVDAKFWYERYHAVDVGLAYSLNRFYVAYADYLYHPYSPINRHGHFWQELKLYFGIGMELLQSTTSKRTDSAYFEGPGSPTFGVGLRVPVGAEWLIPFMPASIYGEVVPGVGLIPSTFRIFQTSVGARYYFK